MFEVKRDVVWHPAAVSADPAVPSGVVTFLSTDVEGSTRRWEADADQLRTALAAHDKVLREAIEGLGRCWPAAVNESPSRRETVC
jgi:class 3 adenylate cyclase